MLTREEIKMKISNGNNNLSNSNIELLSQYFISLIELNIINDEELINSLINKVINQLENIIYYDNNDEELLKKLGISKNNKGLSKENIIYVNKNMTDELVKITLFHELTHFLQRFHIEGMKECIGVMQNYKWRILMEAQTQNIAEMIYSKNYGNYKDIVEYKSEDLRMLPGGTIRSNLRNYQMYDSILKKICIVLGISIEDFIKINFQGIQAKEIFEDKINKAYGEEVTSILNELLDIIYSTDAIIYTGGINDLSDPYIVDSLIDGRRINASSKNQFKQLKNLDKLLMILSKNDIEKVSELLDNQFVLEESYLDIKSKNEEQNYSAHYENGVESVNYR